MIDKLKMMYGSKNLKSLGYGAYIVKDGEDVILFKEGYKELRLKETHSVIINEVHNTINLFGKGMNNSENYIIDLNTLSMFNCGRRAAIPNKGYWAILAAGDNSHIIDILDTNLKVVYSIGENKGFIFRISKRIHKNENKIELIVEIKNNNNRIDGKYIIESKNGVWRHQFIYTDNGG